MPNTLNNQALRLQRKQDNARGRVYVTMDLNDIHAESGSYLQIFAYEPQDHNFLDRPRPEHLRFVDCDDAAVEYILRTYYRRSNPRTEAQYQQALARVIRTRRWGVPQYPRPVLEVMPGDVVLVYRHLAELGAQIQVVKVRRFNKTRK